MSVTCVAPSSVLQRPLAFRRGAGYAAGLFGEIDVDNFAGGGGVGMGFELATGKAFDIAINHDPASIAMHKANHPHTRHLCESVWAGDPIELAAGRPVRLAWFSPDCKHFSRAKGAKPVEKKIRGLAWVAVRWAKRVRPRIIMLENVREFMDWGPLTPEHRPCPLRKGMTFKRFVSTLRNLGYDVEWKVLNAADYGAPTHRRRLFLIARSDERAIVWPEKTHGAADRESGSGAEGVRNSRAFTEGGKGNQEAGGQRGSLGGKERRAVDADQPIRDRQNQDRSCLKPYRTAAQCIDWTIPCPSIFDRKRPLADKTLRRIALGIVRYVINNPKPFIVRICQSGSQGPNSRQVEAPLTTIVTKAEHCLVTPTLMPVNHGGDEERSRSPKRPMNTLTASRCEYVAVAELRKSIIVDAETNIERRSAQGNGSSPSNGDQSGSNLRSEHLGENGIGRGRLRHRDGRGIDLQGDFADRSSVCISEEIRLASLVQTGYGERAGQQPRALDIDRPLGTIVAGGSKHALVSALIAKHYGGVVGHAPTRPLGTVTALDHHSVVSATLVGVGGRAGQSPPCGVDEPCRTTTAKADRALVAATLTQFRGSNNGNGGDVEQPAPTQTAENRPGLVAAFLTKWYGNDQHGQGVDQPAHKLTVKDRIGLVTVELADGSRGVVVKVPASKGIEGGEYIIADIGLRMLTPRELARCQGFPDSYVLTGTQSNQVARIGNSVPPQVVEALVRSNFGEVPA